MSLDEIAVFGAYIMDWIKKSLIALAPLLEACQGW